MNGGAFYAPKIYFSGPRWVGNNVAAPRPGQAWGSRDRLPSAAPGNEAKHNAPFSDCKTGFSDCWRSPENQKTSGQGSTQSLSSISRSQPSSSSILRMKCCGILLLSRKIPVAMISFKAEVGWRSLKAPIIIPFLIALVLVSPSAATICCGVGRRFEATKDN